MEGGVPVRPTFRLHDSSTHRERFFFSLPMLVPILVPDSSTEHAAPLNGEVASKSLGTDMPISIAAASLLLLPCLLDGMGMGIDDEDNCVLKFGVLVLLLDDDVEEEDEEEEFDVVLLEEDDVEGAAGIAKSALFDDVAICSPMLSS